MFAAPSTEPRRWPKVTRVAALLLVFGIVILYVVVFVRIVPPKRVRVVDAITGKPLANMNVCVQVWSNGWSKQALRSKLIVTNSNGSAFFWPSILALFPLQSFDGYAIQVSDPKSDFVQTCGPQVGFSLGLAATEGADKFADAQTDGSVHFPVELVSREELPKNIGWFPFMRGTAFHALMTVELVPVMHSPDDCKPILDPQSQQECTRLNTMSQNALLQELLPMYFAGMQRATIQISPGWSPGTWFYTAVYDTRSIPPRYLAVSIERFSKGQDATPHLGDITRAITDYDPSEVIEEEVSHGQKVKRILSSTNPKAFWASQNLLVLITIPTRSVFDRTLINQWIMRHPCNTDPNSL